jgi:CheY-like chemotaxis protein
MPRNSVLVIDDDRDVRENLAYALELEGYEVQKTENGRLALEMLRKMPAESLPGCILLDLMMPVMNGYELLESMQAESPSLRSIPVVVATARGNPEKFATLPENVELIKKPMDLDELYRVIGKYCTKD